MRNEELTAVLGAVHSGDTDAFTALYQEMRTPLFTIIYRIVWDLPTAEDVLQDLFVKLLASPPEPSLRNPRAYLCQMARNLAIDSTRKQRPIQLNGVEAAYHPLESLSQRVDIEAALRSLPSDECQIVTLHLIGALKFREIAAMLNKPLGTVLWRYQQALGALRQALSGG